MDIQPHLCCAPARWNQCIRKLGDKGEGEGGVAGVRMEGVIARAVCSSLPWWHIDSVDYICTTV